ncbi:MAG: dephospho-CoA kinase [Alkalibacterium sp.]|nr:dephospho-CoA kinase [Alkalibacterium sp.]
MAFILGLTGGIATGKSAASAFFKKRNIPVVDADIGARVVMEPGNRAYQKAVELFGSQIVNKDKTINRRKLGSIVFNDKDKMDQLNAIVRKDIFNWIRSEKQAYIDAGHPLIVLDIPLLFEAGYESEVDEIMVITTDETTQLERLMSRDQISKTEALSRISSQQPMDSKRDRADSIINNNGTIEETHEQLDNWLTEKGY